MTNLTNDHDRALVGEHLLKELRANSMKPESWVISTIVAGTLLVTCQRHSPANPRGAIRAAPAITPGTAALKHGGERPAPLWPIPRSAIKITKQMWALTIEPTIGTVRPQRHSNTVVVYGRTAYDTAGNVLSGPSIGMAGLEYFTAPWQELYLSMSAGEVKRVWVLNPGRPVVIYDVTLRSVIPVK